MKKLPKIITQQDFEVLFKAAQDIESKAKSKSRKNTIRQYRISMLLAFEGGMRISEIVGYKDKVPPLQKDKVEDSQIRIESGKGGKDRIVPKPKRLNQAAVDMLPLTIKRRSLQSFVTELGRNVLNKEMTFHTLRHGFGSHLAGSGRPLHEIQMLMGHSRLDTTGIYLHANPKEAINGAREVF